MGAGKSTQLSQLAICDGPPARTLSMLDVWQEGGAALVAPGGVLSREDSRFVMLRCAVKGSWRPIVVNHSLSKFGVPPFLQGQPLSTASSASSSCRLLLQQPTVGDPSQVYLRAAGGQDTHMGYLLFVNGMLCERSCVTGSASHWERLVLRPTRFRMSWCFHLFSHQSGKPVCFSKRRVHDGKRHQYTFELRKPHFPGEMVVFSIQDFSDLESMLVAEPIEFPPTPCRSRSESCDSADSMAEVSTLRSAIGYVARSTQSVVSQAFALPRQLPGMLMGSLGRSLFTAAETCHSGALQSGDCSALTRRSARDHLKQNGAAFTFLKSSQYDSDSGQAVSAENVVRGSRRIEKVSFKAHQDLKELTRIVKVSVAFFKFSSKHVMGNFLASQEPHEVTFPEQSIPRASPAGTYNIELSYVASNMDEPLFIESKKFKMV